MNHDPYEIKSEFVSRASIPPRAPLRRKSRWDSKIEKVFQAPPGHVVRYVFGRSLEGRRSMISFTVAIKRRGLKCMSRGGDLYVSAQPFVPEEINRVAVPEK